MTRRYKEASYTWGDHLRESLILLTVWAIAIYAGWDLHQFMMAGMSPGDTDYEITYFLFGLVSFVWGFFVYFFVRSVSIWYLGMLVRGGQYDGSPLDR